MVGRLKLRDVFFAKIPLGSRRLFCRRKKSEITAIYVPVQSYTWLAFGEIRPGWSRNLIGALSGHLASGNTSSIVAQRGPLESLLEPCARCKSRSSRVLALHFRHKSFTAALFKQFARCNFYCNMAGPIFLKASFLLKGRKWKISISIQRGIFSRSPLRLKSFSQTFLPSQ